MSNIFFLPSDFTTIFVAVSTSSVSHNISSDVESDKVLLDCLIVLVVVVVVSSHTAIGV